ncbi:hypothetical protein [Paractinoplanes globisporus]|uniref:Uncharacterized protein n=1 Tax=Paractinoplanes globisporus TaxID=113565 RepID=A0ABW6WMF6_9ACTN|nr:hypothetical protein [Actinoplanes globisporus]
MSTLHTRSVMSLLTAMTADPDLLGTALARQAVIHALAGVVGGLAMAATVLADKVYPPLSARRRAGGDRRWRTVATHLDHAATGAQRAEHLLNSAAGRCHRLIRDGEIVEYHGSLKPQHGRYGIDGPCICVDCEDRGLTLQLHPVRGGHLLTCVNPESVSPIPALDTDLSRHARQAERLLSTGLDPLPASLDAQHALYQARSLAVLTSRTRTVLAGWEDLFGRMLNRHWWSFDTDGGSPWTLKQHIVTAFEQAGNNFPQVTADLRRAVGVLAAIEAEPAGTRAA